MFGRRRFSGISGFQDMTSSFSGFLAEEVRRQAELGFIKLRFSSEGSTNPNLSPVLYMASSRLMAFCLR